jgi:adenosylcobinamide-GDP ribazoletransferase
MRQVSEKPWVPRCVSGSPSLRNTRQRCQPGKGTSVILRDILGDLRSALGLLTRLPLPAMDTPRGAQAAWAWPVVGVVIGGLAAIVAWGLLALGVPMGIVAGAVLVTQVITTGALHEDGLADTVDGFFGGWTKERRLEIMKDSHIGSYGTLALILSVGLRWSALTVVCNAPMALIAVAALSRAPMAVVMAALPNTRGTGLAQSVGRPGAQVTAIAVLIAVVVSGTTAGPWAATLMVLGIAVVTLMVAQTAHARIGGQTGDVLGATQAICEVVGLAVLATVMA